MSDRVSSDHERIQLWSGGCLKKNIFLLKLFFRSKKKVHCKDVLVKNISAVNNIVLKLNTN